MNILGAFSERGDGMDNEDIYGYRDNVFWVIDGATDLFHLNLFDCDDDVAYYVRCLSKTIFNNISAIESLKSIVIKAINDANNICNINVSETEAYKFPSFAIVVARINESKLEYFVLGDCTLLLNTNNGIVEITDKRLLEFSKRNRAGIERLLSSDAFDHVTEIEIYRETRFLMNKKNGYWIGSVDLCGIDHAIEGVLKIDEDTKIIGCTDGFMEAFNLFDIANIDKNIFDAFALEKISKELRKRQNEDQERNKARVRTKDDLTYILVR